MHRLFARLAIGATLSLVAVVSSAQGYPAKPIRILVPFPPGGGTDVVARALTEPLMQSLGQPIVVDNRLGGGSIIATEAAARAPADGYTLLLTTDFHSINEAFGIKLPYDSMRDFAFVTKLIETPLMLVAHPSAQLRSIKDLVERAKREPGRLSFGSLGSSSPHFLGFEWFKRLAGIDVIDVPYKGIGPASADVLGGQVTMMFMGAATGMRHAEGGKLVPLGVTSAKRMSVAPGIATIAEGGYPEFSLTNWYGLFAPARTSTEIVTRLSEEVGRALRQPAVLARLASVGVEAAPSSSAELEAFVRADIEKYRRIIRLTGAKPEGR